MSELQKLELDILELLNRLTLRLTLEQVASIGEYLIEAKKLVPHGNRRGERDRGWQNWLARMGLKERTAQEYIMVAKEMAQAFCAFTGQSVPCGLSSHHPQQQAASLA